MGDENRVPGKSSPTVRSKRRAPTPPRVGGDLPDARAKDPYTKMDRSEQLGKLVAKHVSVLQSTDWFDFILRVRKRNCLHPHVGMLPHPASPLLDDLCTYGAPATFSTPPWTVEQNDAAVARGCHKSATDYQGFLEQEMVDFINKGYYVVLPYKIVRLMENLRICPIGVVPQRDRRPRPISDYTYYGTNPDTIKTAPQEAMQFGRTLDRVLYQIHHADPKYGPVHLLKLDISDGFYRVPVRAEHIPSLGMIMPYQDGEDPLIAFPLRLPMGWTESPPYFSVLTETIIDLVNERLGHWDPPPHPLEKVASTPAPPPDARPIHYIGPPSFPDHLARRITVNELPPPRRPHRRLGRRPPLSYSDVYVDDEALLGQGSPSRLNRLRRVLFHVNDLIFRPNDATDIAAGRAEPASHKKMLKGDACWATTGIFLGWLIDTLRGTLELPPHRRQRLSDCLTTFRGRKRCSLRDVQKLLGELRSMSQGIPGCRGLFSQLQHDLQAGAGNRVRLRQPTLDHLEDLAVLAADLDSRPTRLGEVVPSHPRYKGACDAAKAGMGGVWLPPSPDDPSHHPPIVWRHPFPTQVQKRIVSTSHPLGDITNSDLELAGTIAHEWILANTTDVTESTISTGCDNTAAVSWRTKGSTTTSGPAAYLLRLASLQQRQYRYRSEVFYLPGDANVLADIASRRFDLTDTALLSLLDTIAPQAHPWELRRLPSEQHSMLTSALLCKRPPRPSLHSVPYPTPGSGPIRGSRSSPPLASAILTSRESQTRYKSSKSTPTASGTGEHPIVVNRSTLAPYEITYSRFRRRSPYWASATHAWTPPVPSIPA